MKKQRNFKLDEVIMMLMLRDYCSYNLDAIAAMMKRPKETLRSKFQSLPPPNRLKLNQEPLKTFKGISTVEELYEVFGVKCPETQEELNRDMFERFKKWEEKLLSGEV